MSVRGQRSTDATGERQRRSEERFEQHEQFTVHLPEISIEREYLAAVTSHTFSASYSLGGEDPNPAFPATPTLTRVMVQSANGYTVQYAPGSGKFVAYSAPGTEVLATTNLSGLGALPVLLLCERPQEHVVLRVDEAVSLATAKLVVQSDVARSSSHYWKIRLQVVRDADGLIEDLGSLSTADVALDAHTEYDLLGLDGGSELVRLAVGDLLRVRFEDSGRAPSLVAPIVIVTARRL